MQALATQWTKKDKKLMADVSGEICILMKKRFDKDKLMAANCLDILHTSFYEQAGFEKVLRLNKEGKIIKKQVTRVLGIIQGMQESDFNLLLFRNCPEIWMQYYMALFFEMDTYIIALEQDRPALKRMRSHLVKHVEYVINFNPKIIESAVANIKKIIDTKDKQP